MDANADSELDVVLRPQPPQLQGVTVTAPGASRTNGALCGTLVLWSRRR